MAKWIQNATKNRGALHAHLGVKSDEPIPEEKLEAATHSKNSKIRKEANLAKTLKGMHHKPKAHGMSSKHIAKTLYS
jgi:hypothetical protein